MVLGGNLQTNNEDVPLAETTDAPQKRDLGTELARSRTLLAMDRTLLAWVRTSLSLIAFGFTLAKFVHDLISTGHVHGMDVHYPRHLGVLLMVLGIGGLLGGAAEHYFAVKRLKKDFEISAWSTSLTVATVVAVIAIFLMVNLLSDLNLTVR